MREDILQQMTFHLMDLYCHYFFQSIGNLKLCLTHDLELQKEPTTL